MECKIREWKMEDAAELAATLNNKNIQDNLRDGLPYPYTEDDAKFYINEMLKADKNSVFAFAITADHKVVVCFAKITSIRGLRKWGII